MPDYLKLEEAANLLGLEPEQVGELCRSGDLPGAVEDAHQNSWLIPSEAIAAYLAQRAAGRQETRGRSRSEISTGDQIKVGDVSQSYVAIGRQSRVTVTHGLQGEELARLFAAAYQRIEARPEDRDVDKTEIKETVQKIEQEVAQGEQANPNKIDRWLKTLEKIAPDILEVIVTALLNPGAGAAAVVRKVAEKARGAAG
jgi:hypothetical protein